MKTETLKNRPLSPAAQHIVQKLEQRIVNGEYTDGQRLPTERFFAEEFGVSRLIIRAALREMEQRGFVRCSLHCRPVVSSSFSSSSSSNKTAAALPVRALKEGGRHSVAVWIWPGPGDPSASANIRGIRSALDSNDYRLLLETPECHSWEDTRRAEARFLLRMAEKEPDCAGILLWYLGGAENIPALNRVRDAGIPLVFLDRRPPEGFEADHVGIDNVRAAEMAVEYLLSLGHRRIIHLTNGERVSTVKERENGYRKALRRARTEAVPEWILHPMNTATDAEAAKARQVVYEKLLRLLAGPEPPTAVFAVNDLEALYLIDYLKGKGISVPEHLSVIGVDGAERWRPGASYLSTMSQPFERIGETAAELLLERSAKPQVQTWRHILHTATLIAGETIGPPAEADTAIKALSLITESSLTESAFSLETRERSAGRRTREKRYVGAR